VKPFFEILEQYLDIFFRFLGFIVKAGYHFFGAGVNFIQCDRYAILLKCDLLGLKMAPNPT